MLFWWSIREAKVAHEVVRDRWEAEMQARRLAEKRADHEAASIARRRAMTLGRLMQRLEKRLIRKGVLP